MYRSRAVLECLLLSRRNCEYIHTQYSGTHLSPHSSPVLLPILTDFQSIPTYTLTISTTTSYSTVTTTTSSKPPTTTCSANLLTDPKNCGYCGHVCDSGVCNNGVCSSNQCERNQTCSGGFHTCGGSNCFCFSDAKGAGFCGQNAVCAGAKACTVDKDW